MPNRRNEYILSDLLDSIYEDIGHSSENALKSMKES